MYQIESYRQPTPAWTISFNITSCMQKVKQRKIQVSQFSAWVRYIMRPFTCLFSFVCVVQHYWCYSLIYDGTHMAPHESFFHILLVGLIVRCARCKQIGFRSQDRSSSRISHQRVARHNKHKTCSSCSSSFFALDVSAALLQRLILTWELKDDRTANAHHKLRADAASNSLTTGDTPVKHTMKPLF